MSDAHSADCRHVVLTAEQKRILDFLAPADGEGLTLAHDIAYDLDIPPRAMGAKLCALEQRGLVRRRIVTRAKTPRQSHLYGWEITVEGWDASL